MEIFVCTRRTLDWCDEGHVEANILPEFRSKFELWNATFEMSYAAFRARLKAIAQQNLAQVEGATLTGLGEIAGPDALIVPIDDDDWLAPSLPAEIRRALGRDPARRERAGVYWTREFLSPTRRPRRFEGWLRQKPKPGRWTCYTNNYAVRSGLPDFESLARNHVHASGFFDAEPGRVLRIPKTLAIQNRNLASQTALGWGQPAIDREFLVETYESYRRFYADSRLRRSLRWAQPCIDGMAELMEDLQLQ